MIIKLALPDTTAAAHFLCELNLCEKEMEMYETILPRMQTLLRKANFPRKICANTYFVSKTHQAMVLEDLVVAGYRMDTNKAGFDTDHAEMVLTNLARFHAAGAVLQEIQPDIFRNFQNGKTRTVRIVKNFLGK